jgi:carboxyl-terminal processing protease
MRNRATTPIIMPDNKSKIFKQWAILGLVGFFLFAAGWAVGGGKVSVNGFDSIEANRTLSSSLDYSSVNDAYKLLIKYYDGTLDAEKLTEGMKKGLLEAAGDPYTQYFNSSQAKEFFKELDGSFEGIGAQLGQDANGNVVVIAPLADSPAAKAGIKPQDIIVKIDGKDAVGISVNDAVTRIRGAKDTTVNLELLRDNKKVEVSVVRGTIDLPSVKSEVKDGIGIIEIAQFSDDTGSLARKAAEDLKKQNVKGIILDLRSNPGGLVDAAVDVASLWMPKGSTVLTERRGGQVRDELDANGNNILGDIPTVVLINEGSASASEIVAGALKDSGKATLVGKKSYGKGSVQTTEDLKSGEMLKITIARWYTPNGKNIDKEGISPDKEVSITDDDIKNQRDPQLEAAINELKN